MEFATPLKGRGEFYQQQLSVISLILKDHMRWIGNDGTISTIMLPTYTALRVKVEHTLMCCNSQRCVKLYRLVCGKCLYLYAKT